MFFTFKRDKSGCETAHAENSLVWQRNGNRDTINPTNVTVNQIYDAIERAEQAGFWREVLLDYWTDEVVVYLPSQDLRCVMNYLRSGHFANSMQDAELMEKVASSLERGGHARFAEETKIARTSAAAPLALKTDLNGTPG